MDSPAICGGIQAPYRGLAAMTEADSDFFFGRGRETVDVLSALASTPDRLPVLIGNSGVGKSSLAQAGVLAALKRQALAGQATGAPNAWPQAFEDSRQWCFLSPQARHRAAQGAGRNIPRHVAIRCNRSRAGEAAEWLD